MFFIILTFAAALLIEGLGSLVSVIGISALFGANLIIIALAIALDIGKVVTVSLLYSHWKSLSRLMKTYALMAATVTMIITSSGAAGYLSEQFQLAIQGAKVGDVKITALKAQQEKYEARKKQIDDQIANLPTKTTVSQRLRLMNGFKEEQKALDAKIADIDKQLPQQQIDQIGTESKAGPILEIAKAFNIPVEQAVKWVILLIISVFDPLAIFLIISGNFLWAKRKRELNGGLVHATTDIAPKLEEFDPEKHGGEFPNEKAKDMVVEDFVDNFKEGRGSHVTELPGGDDIPETAFNVDHDAALASLREHIASTGGPDFTQPLPEPAIQFPKVNIDVPSAETEEALEEARRLAQERKEREFWEEQERQASEARKFKPTGVLSTITPEPIDSHLPVKRQEITKSTLGLVTPDPGTNVDAHTERGFRKAQVMTTPTKK